MDAEAAFWEERGEGAAATLRKFANDWGRLSRKKQFSHGFTQIQHGKGKVTFNHSAACIYPCLIRG